VKKNLPRIVLGRALLAVFLGHAAKLWRIDLVDRLENVVYVSRSPSCGSCSAVLRLPGYPPERFMTRSYQRLEWLEVGG
jgi:hypothetical protein